MNINKSAPVIAAGEIEVAAYPEIVWDVMAGIDRWPAWNPDVKSAHLAGELAEGLTFRWKAGPGTISSTLQQVERPRTLAWTGNTFGIKAFHVWRLEPKDGKTIVRTEESWEGLLPRIFRGSMQKMLQRSIDAGLSYLKAEAERRSSL
ncbi:MAG TPA: SRPBCC family protein [Methanotrichaceae archaeon]|nr:SRPBCC family protein [Methanotrichaceae archaeon]